MSPTAIPGNLLLKNGMVITGSEKNPVDLDRSNVSLLLHGDGANGSTTIVDSSPSPKTVTAVGNAQISTAQSKFGGSSISCVTASDYLTIASAGSASFRLDGDFTWETWIYKNVSGWHGIYTGDVISSPNFRIFSFSDDTLRVDIGGSGAGNYFGVIPTGSWAHIAVVRSSGSLQGYVNGVGGTPFASSFTVPNTANSRIGLVAGFLLNGYIDDFRITKGIARYTSNFTPPTAPFPDI